MITKDNDKWNIFHVMISDKNLSILRNMSMCLDYENVESIISDMVELYIQDILYKGTIDETGMIEGLKHTLE